MSAWTEEALEKSRELAVELGQNPPPLAVTVTDTDEVTGMEGKVEEEQTAERSVPGPSEVNMFTVDPNGYKCHWKIGQGTPDAELRRLMLNQQKLSTWLIQHNYEPDRMRDYSNGSSAPQSAAPDPETACPDCGGATEYKTGKTKNGKPWAGYFCLRTKDSPRDQRHAPRWLEN